MAHINIRVVVVLASNTPTPRPILRTVNILHRATLLIKVLEEVVGMVNPTSTKHLQCTIRQISHPISKTASPQASIQISITHKPPFRTARTGVSMAASEALISMALTDDLLALVPALRLALKVVAAAVLPQLNSRTSLGHRLQVPAVAALLQKPHAHSLRQPWQRQATRPRSTLTTILSVHPRTCV